MAASSDLGEARGKIILDTDMSGLADGEKGLDSFGKKADETGQKTQSVDAALKTTSTGALVAGGIIAAGFAIAVGGAADFEARMSAIQAVSGATAGEMAQINDAALRIGKDTSFSASEAALAMEELLKAGVSTTDVLNGAADATVALAAAGGVDLPEAATIAANAMNQFGLGAEDLVKVADQIAGAANASAIDVSQFGYSLSQVGAVANLVGASFEDTTTAIALMGNAGIVGSDAGTSLKSMFMRLNPSTAEAAGLMKELGLITEDGTNRFYDANGSMKSMSEVAQVLQDSLAGMTDQQQQAALTTLFGADAIRGAAILADNGAAGFDKMAESIGKVSAADVAATRLENMQGKTEALMGSVETLSIMVGQKIIPVLTAMVESVTEAVNWFASLDEGWQNLIVGGAGVAAALLLAFGATVKITQAAIAGAAAMRTLAASKAALKVAEIAGSVATGIATAAQWALNAALTANPIGIIIVAIAALVAGLIWFFTQTELGQALWSGFMTFLTEAWTNIASFFTTVWGGIATFFTDLWNGIMTVVGMVVDWFMTYVAPLFAAVIALYVGYFNFWYDIVKAVINGIMTVVGAVVDWFMTYVAPLFQAWFNLVAAIFNFFWETVKWVFEQVSSFIGTVVKAIVDFAIGYFNFWLDTIKAILGFIWDVIKTVWTAVSDFLRPYVQAIVDFVVGLWQNLVRGITITLDAIWSVIQTIWNGIRSFIEPIVQGIVSFVTSVWNGLVGIVGGIFRNVVNAIKGPLGDVMGFFEDVYNDIVGFFADAGEWLADAGQSIIDGLIGGIQDALGGLTDILNGVTDMIPKEKGPPEKDAKLLTPAGEAIMQSLMIGMDNEIGKLYDMLGGVNVGIPAAMAPTAYGAASGKASASTVITLQVDWHAAPGDTADTKRQVMEMLGGATDILKEELVRK